MTATTHSTIKALIPFWIFVLLFKFGAGLHYTLLSTIGSQVLPVWIVGLLVGGGALLQLILDVPAGYTLDRFGYVRLLRLSTFVFVIASVALLFNLSPLVFVVTLILSTVSWLFFGPGANAYMLSNAPSSAGKYIGFYHTMSSLGVVLATVILTVIIDRSPQFMGLVIGTIILVAWVSILLTKREKSSVHEERKTTHHTYYIRRHFISHLLKTIKKLNPASTILMLQNLTGCMFYGVIWFTIPLVLAQGSHEGLLGISLSVFDLAVVVLGTLLGRIADQGNQRKLIFLGLLTFGVTGTLLGFNLNLWFILLGFLATAGDEMSSVSLWSWLNRLDKNHNEDGLINGAIIMFEDLGWTIGPMFAGILYSWFGPALTITLAALPILGVWLVALFITHRSEAVLTPVYTEYPKRHRHKR